MIYTGPQVVEWVAERVGGRPDWAVGVGFGGDEIAAGFMLHHPRFDHGQMVEIELSLAIERPERTPRKGFMAFMAYAFDTLGLRRVTVRIAPENRRSRALAKGAGFKEEGTLRDADMAGDLVIYGMTHSDFMNSPFLRKV